MMEGRGGRKKSQCDEKGVKYLIYLPWRRETNAFTVIEDASPSHTNTHTHTRIRAFWLKEELDRKSKGETHFPEAEWEHREKRKRNLFGEGGVVQEKAKRPK